MNQVRFWEVWDELLARLNTARMQHILQGGKIYLEGSDYSQPEGAEDKPWGRLILVPTANLWPDDTGVGPTRTLSFLSRAEVHPIRSAAFNPQKTLDGLQDEVFVQLSGYVIQPHKYVMGATPLWLARGAQPLPLWDDERGMYFTSAEWRCEVAPPPPVA